MTGRDELIDAAQREAAAFYSRPAGDTSIATRQRNLLDDELALVEALHRNEIRRAIEQGITVDGLMWQFSMTRAEATVAMRSEGRTAA